MPNDNITHSITVGLENNSYEVKIGRNILADIGEEIKNLNLSGKCAVITDSNVSPLYEETVLENLRSLEYEAYVITVPAGESSKSMKVVTQCCSEMISQGLDRSSFVIALGGGVVGDLAGFVASIFYRGIPFIQIPTTIVSQVDSSVGGKTGVNAPDNAGKNLIGTFHQPRLVWIDVDTLGSLPDREYNEGFAEIIKHAAIRDPEMIPLIKSCLQDRSNLEELVANNIKIKARIVEEDERETTGTRALLNFGHTIGHGIEAAAKYKLLHGEAIGLGLRSALRLSVEKSGLPQSEADQITELIDLYGLPETLPTDLNPTDIVEALKKDKKFFQGNIHFVLLKRLGEAYVSQDITMADIESQIEALK